MAVRNVEYIIGLRDRFSKKMGRMQTKTQSFNNTMLGLRNTVGTLFAGFLVQRVIGDIIKVGSNFEQLQISFETMLGSAEKAKVLLADITKFAIKTPFELKDVAKGAKSLLAFGIEQEKIIPTLKILGDVAAGLSIPIERLILNFGQVKTQSRLTGREIRDFAIAGVPLLDELAKVMGKSTSEITKLVSAGDVGFAIVEKAFQNMAGEGGKFFNLMIKQTASTSGQISNLQDFIGLLQRDLFNKFKPTIDSVVVSIQKLTVFFRNNIDAVVRIIRITGKLIRLFLVYKALQISVNFVVGIAIGRNKLYRLSLILLNKGLLFTIRSMKAFRLALASTGIGIAILALSQLVIILATLKKRQTTVEVSQIRLNAAFEKAKEKTEKQTEKLRDLIFVLNLKTKADFVQKRALTELQKIFPKYFKNLDVEKAKLIDIDLLQKKIAEGNRLRAVLLERTAAKEKLEEIKGELFVQRRVSGKFRTEITPEAFEKEREQRLREQRGLVAKLTLTARRTKDNIVRLEIQERIDRIKKDLIDTKPLEKLAAEQAGITKIVSAAPKIFNINIEKLVETINNNVTNIKEGMNESKKIIVEVLLSALNDTQATVR